MKNSYRFFQNRECEYFPCHSVKDDTDFNCLFCFCPLYWKEQCLGNPVYIKDARGQKIKDCTNCTIVHRPDMYDRIVKKLMETDQTFSIDIRSIWDTIWERVARMASWEQMDQQTYREHKAEATSGMVSILEKDKTLYSIKVLLQPFEKECIQAGFFMFGETNIRCNILEKICREQIVCGYLYCFHAPDIPMGEKTSLLMQYYIELFQIACMDVTKEYVQEYLEKKHSTDNAFCSPSFGPGYYGMNIDAVKPLLDLMNSQKAGVSWKQDNMQPSMSIAGIYLVSVENLQTICKDCESCLGMESGCSYCYGRKQAMDKKKRG